MDPNKKGETLYRILDKSVCLTFLLFSAFTFPKIAFDGGETPVTDSDVDMTFAETVLLLGETLIEDDEIVDRTVVTDS